MLRIRCVISIFSHIYLYHHHHLIFLRKKELLKDIIFNLGGVHAFDLFIYFSAFWCSKFSAGMCNLGYRVSGKLRNVYCVEGFAKLHVEYV